MSSWLVLLVALVACLGLGGAQDPVPVSLVNLVMNSPISSMKDLQELLDVHSVDKEEEEDEEHTNGTHKRFPRSLGGDVQMAQPAVCKVRTEVMEVTRSMLDRSNANFLLWPLCVEVQRCSGCCNTRTLQCVPVATETRHLQMTKIQFVNREPVYEKVVLPVVDHVSCSCKSHVVSHTSPAPPPRLLTKPAISKSQSKEELHRHDDLKHNQRFQLEDQGSQWQSKYTLTHTQRAPVHTPAHTPARTLTHTKGSSQDASTRHASFGVTRMLSDRTQQDFAHPSGPEKVPEHQTHPGSGDDKEHPEHHHMNHGAATKRQHNQSKSHHHDQSDVTLDHSGQLEAPVVRFSHVEVIGQSSGQTELSGQSATPSFQVKDQDRSQSEAGQEKTEHHHHQHHHHPAQASSQRAATNAPTSNPLPPHTTPPPVPQRKRRRKHRRRMSKSAMRAMIMVMS
ncbi:uncharacterized protein si:ch211-79m20.1 [Silurus meridionalis]|uniref:Platelet-derived growth factor (PDGF) family profile domain-containing protein n=1 Tax=Silurus meridionalis TaxID=175797 RepID=A0A8T0ABD8_SILME|nr:uncharacterized protein si:ch211-79m20.1 [Silurus meridionalis]KAF7688308.1 hypothetical protein HF521_014314 [Silurus meridionalis]